MAKKNTKPMEVVDLGKLPQPVRLKIVCGSPVCRRVYEVSPKKHGTVVVCPNCGWAQYA